MRSMLQAFNAALLIALAGCASRPPAEPAINYVEVPMPVPAPCVVDRPAPVVPMNAQVAAADWAARAPGAKAQAVRAQAGRRMNHADALAAATSGCAAAQ